MPIGDISWSHAFIWQAKSDLNAYELLAESGLPSCHYLHYLQMWLEKLCKAYLWNAASTRTDLPDFKTSHNVIAKVLPQLIKENWRRAGYSSPPDFKAIRSLCREIDLLHPAVDDGSNRPDNVEYPWAAFHEGMSVIIAPAKTSFKVSDRIHNHVGRKLMKAAAVLTREPTVWLG